MIVDRRLLIKQRLVWMRFGCSKPANSWPVFGQLLRFDELPVLGELQTPFVYGHFCEFVFSFLDLNP